MNQSGSSRASPSVLWTAVLLLSIAFSFLAIAQETQEGTAPVPDSETAPEPTPDSETTPEPTPDPLPPAVTIVSPVQNAVITQSGIVIIVIEPTTESTRAWFEIDGQLSTPLAIENHFLGDFNSLQLENGIHTFSAHACQGEACAVSSVAIEIRNELPPDFNTGSTVEPDAEPIDEPDDNGAFEPTATEYSVKGSNLFSALTAFNPDGSIAISGSDYVKIKEGTYNFQIDFFEITTGTPAALKSVFITRGIIQEDGPLVEVDREIPLGAIELPHETVLSEQDYSTIQKTPSEWIALFGIKTNLGFESEKIILAAPAGAELLFKCAEWSFLEKKCSTKFEQVPVEKFKEKIEIENSDASAAFGFAKNSVIITPPEVFSVTPSNANGTFSFYNSQSLFESFTNDPIEIPKGNYNAKMTIDFSPIQDAGLDGIQIDHNAVVLSLNKIEPIDTNSDANEAIVSTRIDYDFSEGSFSVTGDYNAANVQKCSKWDPELNQCIGEWELHENLSLAKEFSVYRFSLLPPDTNFGLPDENEFVPDTNELLDANQISDLNELAEVIQKLKKLRKNNRHFNGNFARERLGTLGVLFSDIEINLECGSDKNVLNNPQPGAVPPDANTLVDANTIQDLNLIQDINPSDPNGLDSNDFVPDTNLLEKKDPLEDKTNPLFFTSQWEERFPQNPQWLQSEDYLECDGIRLLNEFKDDSVPRDTEKTFTLGGSFNRVKHSLTLTNYSDKTQTRLISLRFTTPAPRMESDTNAFLPKQTYALVPTKTETIRIENSDDPEFAGLNYEIITDSALKMFNPENQFMGYYDWTDLVKAPVFPQTVIHTQNASSIIETLLEIQLAPNQTIVIDPVYDLSDSSNFNTRWNGGVDTDSLGSTSNSGVGVQLVNVDNNAYSNDLLLTADAADVNGKTNNGAVYLIKDIDKKSSVFDLNNIPSFAVRWNGGATTDLLGRTNTSGSGVQLVNVDGNAYSNDLLLTAYAADVNGKTDGGGVYLVKDIDQKSGVFDLINIPAVAARWNLGASDFLGSSATSGLGVQLVNVDGNAYSNDLLLTADQADVNNKSNSGGVWLVKDVDRKSGAFDLNSTIVNYDVRWNLGKTDRLGGNNNSGLGVQLVNVDNNASANDLLLTAYAADVNNKINNGAVYLVKDINTKSGAFDLNSTIVNYDVRWNGGVVTDNLGNTSNSGLGVQLVDVDNNAYSNDLLLTAYLADVNGKANTGGVYLVKDVDKKSGAFDLNAVTNFDVRWNGGATTDQLGLTSVLGVQLVNVDNNAYSNDLLLTAGVADVNGKADSGGVYLVKDVDKKSGAFDLSVVTNFDVLWNGGVASDNLGSTSTSGLGVQLVNVDGNAYSNDLLLTAIVADVNGKANSGGVYLVKDIDQKSGVFDLINIPAVAARWNLGPSDNLGSTSNSGSGVQLVNVDNNAYSNDLLLTAYVADVNNKINNGGVWLVKDVDKKSGAFDLNSTIVNYDVRWNGGLATDSLGSTNNSLNLGVQLVNVDNNAYSNDLLFAVPLADVNGKADSGGVYLVKDVDKKSGEFDLNNIPSFDSRWNGGVAGDALGSTSSGRFGAQLVNVDNNAYSNDLLLAANSADLNGKTDNGGVYSIKDIAIAAAAGNDYSFSLLLPSTGCTEGKGSIDAGVSCDKAYFEATDLSGVADNTKVDPEGQTSTIPFFVYDNQSTSSSDLNILLDLNALLPSTLALKASKIYSGWAGTCTGNTDNNCARIGSVDVNLQLGPPSEDVYLGNTTTDTFNRILMKFGISSIPANFAINSAILQMNVLTDLDDDDYSFYHLDQNQGWKESDSYTDLNEMRKGTFLPIASCYAGTGDQNCTITSILQAAYAQGDSNFSIRIEDPDYNSNRPTGSTNTTTLKTGTDNAGAEIFDYKTFGSSEHATPPVLYVSYIPSVNIGRATYSAGTQDLNIFIWADFVAAAVGSTDRNADSNSIAP